MFKKENFLIKLCVILFCQHLVSDLISWALVAVVWYLRGWKIGLLAIVIKFVYGYIGVYILRCAVKRHPLYYLVLVEQACKKSA